MTKTELLIKRVRADDRMCEKINEALDEYYKKGGSIDYLTCKDITQEKEIIATNTIRQIEHYMRFYSRRGKYEHSGCPSDFSDDDKRRLAAYTSYTTAKKKARRVSV